MVPALAGRFLTTVPPGKSREQVLNKKRNKGSDKEVNRKLDRGTHVLADTALRMACGTATPFLLPNAFLSSVAKADVTISDFNAFLYMRRCKDLYS